MATEAKYNITNLLKIGSGFYLALLSYFVFFPHDLHTFGDVWLVVTFLLVLFNLYFVWHVEFYIKETSVISSQIVRKLGGFFAPLVLFALNCFLEGFIIVYTLFGNGKGFGPGGWG